MRKRARHAKVHQVHGDREGLQAQPDPITRAAALRAIGEVVYACRVGEHIKIGHTANLSRRLHDLRATELLGFQAGTYDDEQRLHRELAVWAAKGREYYDPAPPVILAVNAMRAVCHLEPLPYEDAA